MTDRRDAPGPLRIPKEWKPEIQAAAARRDLSPHAHLLKAIRRVLDGENVLPVRSVPARLLGQDQLLVERDAVHKIIKVEYPLPRTPSRFTSGTKSRERNRHGI